jgi:uncharacterized protein (DUF983 family)
MAAAPTSWLKALLRQRCPRCREGRVFRGPIAMNPSCPVCGLSFEREEGYFLGAMYVSYGLSVCFLGLGTLIGTLLLPEWNVMLVCLLVTILYLPLVVPIFRYSRVIWIHFDRWAWPGEG